VKFYSICLSFLSFAAMCAYACAMCQQIQNMRLNVRHVHAGIDCGPLICGLDCPQSTDPESSREVLVEVILSIAASRMFQVDFHSFQVVQMEMEGCFMALLHAIADVGNKTCLLLYMYQL
jgi:hypothetical protein